MPECVVCSWVYVGSVAVCLDGEWAASPEVAELDVASSVVYFAGCGDSGGWLAVAA